MEDGDEDEDVEALGMVGTRHSYGEGMRHVT